MARSTPDTKSLSECAVLSGEDCTISLELDLKLINIIKHNPIYIDSDSIVYFVIPVFIREQSLSIFNTYIKNAIHKFTFLTIDITKYKECPIFFKLSSKKNRPLSKKLWDKHLSYYKPPRRHKF